MEILDAEITGDEFLPEGEPKLKLQRALAEGASGMSVDERFIMSRMAAAVGQGTVGAFKFGGLVLNVPIAAFALHAGLTPKVAYRHLDVAAHAIFDRSITLISEAACTTRFRWVSALSVGENSIDLFFTGTFIRFLYSCLSDSAVPNQQSSDGAMQTQCYVINGLDGLFAFPVENRSRREKRQPRPKCMSFERMFWRATKGLRGVHYKDQLWDIEDALRVDSPWSGKTDPRYYRYTHKDLRKLQKWIAAFTLQ